MIFFLWAVNKKGILRVSATEESVQVGRFRYLYHRGYSSQIRNDCTLKSQVAAGRKDSLLRSVLHLGAIRLNNKEVKNKKEKKVKSTPFPIIWN